MAGLAKHRGHRIAGIDLGMQTDFSPGHEFQKDMAKAVMRNLD
jgi:hypothetical protein